MCKVAQPKGVPVEEGNEESRRWERQLQDKVFYSSILNLSSFYVVFFYVVIFFGLDLTVPARIYV
jgi:hypothetical protein